MTDSRFVINFGTDKVYLSYLTCCEFLKFVGAGKKIIGYNRKEGIDRKLLLWWISFIKKVGYSAKYEGYKVIRGKTNSKGYVISYKTAKGKSAKNLGIHTALRYAWITNAKSLIKKCKELIETTELNPYQILIVAHRLCPIAQEHKLITYSSTATATHKEFLLKLETDYNVNNCFCGKPASTKARILFKAKKWKEYFKELEK